MVGSVISGLNSVGSLINTGLGIYDYFNQNERADNAEDLAYANSAIQNAIALQLLQNSLAPTTNVYGDVTGYDPNTGYFTDPSQRTSELLALGDVANFNSPFINSAAMMDQFGTSRDSAMARELAGGEAIRLRGGSPYTASGIAGLHLQDELGQQQSNMDGARNALGLAAARSTNPQAIQQAASQIGGGASSDISGALARARLNGIPQAENIDASRRTNSGNIVNTLFGRASAGRGSGVGTPNEAAQLSASLSNSPGSGGGFGAAQSAGRTNISAPRPDISQLTRGIDSLFSNFDRFLG